jgi:hypothetical protein
MGWFRHDANTVDPVIVRHRTTVGWQVYKTGSVWRFYLRDSAVVIVTADTAPMTVPSGWRHMAVGRDNSLGRVFIQIDASAPGSATTGALNDLTVATPMMFGAQAGGVLPIIGALGDFVWRKGAPFTWDEIDAHYYNGVTPTNPGGGVVQITWPMREGAGTTAASSPAGYDGTLSAASWTTKTRCKARTAA